ncbi:unnamed protein product [Musa hybrid cultivar]
MVLPQSNTGIFVGLNKGHNNIHNMNERMPQREKPTKPYT